MWSLLLVFVIPVFILHCHAKKWHGNVSLRLHKSYDQSKPNVNGPSLCCLVQYASGQTPSCQLVLRQPI